MSEYATTRSSLDGTGITQAVCPKGHGKERTISADALFVQGADPRTIAARCFEPLTDAAKKTAKADKDGVHGGTLPSNATANKAAFSPGASHILVDNEHYCQEFLVPVEARDEHGFTVRKGGKPVGDADREKQRAARARETERAARAEDGTPTPVGGAYQGTGATGGEKLAAASGAELPKGAAVKGRGRARPAGRKAARGGSKRARAKEPAKAGT